MRDKTYNVLFICTHNSARSIMAEAMFNTAAPGRFQAYSAGSHPAGAVHPLALTTLQHLHFPAEGLRSKDWSEFSAPGAPVMDFVFTVCDQAAAEVCPVWPGQPMSAHWGVPDPSRVEGSELARLKAFRDTALVLKRRIDLLMSLPLASLDRLAIQRKIQDIGTR